MKKNRVNESMGIIIHIYMEISQGNSLEIVFFLLQNQRIGGQNRSFTGWRRVYGTKGKGKW
jgi:hypothetical protein